jgi:hypothetical protein
MARYYVKIAITNYYAGVIDLPADVANEVSDQWVSDNFYDLNLQDTLDLAGGDTTVEECEPDDEGEDA